MTANEAMLIVAERIAKQYGYIESTRANINAIHDDFWGNRYMGIKASIEGKEIKFKNCQYVLPQLEDEKATHRQSFKIDIDMHFGNPRLNIRLPHASAFLTYKEDKLSAVQGFDEESVQLLMEVKEELDNLIKSDAV